MRRFLALLLFGLVCAAAQPAFAAREASFTDPGVNVARGTASNDAIVVEPKADIDTGETFVNVSRRTTVFFINQTSMPVDVMGMSVSGDGNVKADIVSDDCSKGAKSINSGSRCSVSVEVTPISPGAWTSELLLTHSGSGRIVRVKLSGKTAGKSASDKKDSGLSLSTKDVKPIDFGDVTIDQGKVARSALMVNDSPETIALMSIDVIAADNGLERLEQGCAVDMELKPGESCPVTLTWKPSHKGLVSTDLIIRHSGQLGFAVVPVRGNAKQDADKEKDDKAVASSGKDIAGKKAGSDKVPMPMPTTAQELDTLTSGKIPELDGGEFPSLDERRSAKRDPFGGASSTQSGGKMRLIGTVGNRALLLMPDGKTSVVAVGEEIPLSDAETVKVLNILPRQIDLSIGGKKKTLNLEAAPELISKASQVESGRAEKEQAAKAKPAAKGNVK